MWKVCCSKGGLINHQRTMHEKSKLKKMFPCHQCGMEFERDANLVNLKMCDGEEWDGDKKKCGTCGKWLKHKSLTQHKKRCGGSDVGARTISFARKYVRETKPCLSCGRVLSATIMSRHLKICQA